MEQLPEDVNGFDAKLAKFHRSLPGVPTNPITSDELRNFLLQFHFSDEAEEASNIVDSIVAVIHPNDLANMYDAAIRKCRFKALNRVYTLSKLVIGNYGNFQDFCDAAQAWAEDPQVLQLVSEGSQYAVLLRTILYKLMRSNGNEVDRIMDYIPPRMNWILSGDSLFDWNVGYEPLETKVHEGDSVLMSMLIRIQERDRKPKELFMLSQFRLSVLFRAYHKNLRAY